MSSGNLDFVQSHADTLGFYSNSVERNNKSHGSNKKKKVILNYETELSYIFDDLCRTFNFQRDNAANMKDYLITMWESRNAKMSGRMEDLSLKSLLSIYEEYIWGLHSNFTKWYRFVYGKNTIPPWFVASGPGRAITREVMTQLSLWLLIWGESNNLRVMPELLCFIYDIMMTEYKFHTDHKSKINREKDKYSKNSRTSKSSSKLLADTASSSSSYSSSKNIKKTYFLHHVVTPLYNFYQFQITWNKNNDHSHIIGYDDINQCFWSLNTIKQFKLKDGTNYMDLPQELKYQKFNDIEWSKSLKKTYLESRTWYHLITNFHRILTIHISTFWYFSVLNLKPLFTKYYVQTLDNKPDPFILFSIMSLTGTWSCVIALMAMVGEVLFVPKNSNLRRPVKLRFFIIILLLWINLIPPVVILSFSDILRKKHINDNILNIASFVALAISFVTSVFFSFVPLSKIHTLLDNSIIMGLNRYKDVSTYERDSCPQLNDDNSEWNLSKARTNLNIINPFTENWSRFESTEARFCSIGLWVMIWASKFVETFFFLCTSIKDPARDLFLSQMNCSGTDSVLSTAICKNWTKVLLLLLIVTNFVLYLLDTYLWYVIYNTIFSLVRSVYMGMTQLTPWKNAFMNLSSKMKLKLLPWNQEWDIALIADLWNEVVYSMYRENLICTEHVERLVFHLTNDNNLLKPSLLTASNDHFFRSNLFKRSKEIQRRLTFFAQSLHCPLPDPGTVESMPTFTVLVPHYKEKILLSLKDIVKAETINSNITLLEYLKLVYRTEWNSYIEETNKIMGKEFTSSESGNKDLKNLSDDESDEIDIKILDMKRSGINSVMNPFKFTGFKLEVPEQTIRTRIWASLRTQTLYRTISGFMKYVDAIKTLHKLESTKASDLISPSGKTTERQSVSSKAESKTSSQRSNKKRDKKNSKSSAKEKSSVNDSITQDEKSTAIAMKKFHMVCSMQRMDKFNDEEKADRDILLTAFPSLKIAYIEEKMDKAGGRKIYHSCLIDGFCDIDANGNYIPRYRIELSGDPILGNGKSDNQNHSIIFTRGEYIQLIDANQDNYFEECLKIKNILKEFDDSTYEVNNDEYGSQYANDYDDSTCSPVAIVGTREHIFSENNGVLGDIAAGKEKVFGTFFARTLGYINSKLHYGHPDFINSIFITTRGGVSKAQRGLHLNEDIYVGMNVLMRGGRIKHAEYYQCGKGRDLSFNSILNFTTKIGSGMGEQLLSREYFYIGTSLPLDKFLSFFYAHPGFHLNNVFIYISLCLFLVIILNLAVVIDSSILCVYDVNFKQTDPWEPEDCLQLVPVLSWLRRSTIVLLFISMVSFLPLFLQHMNDRGFLSAIKRLSKQMISGAIFFEIFSSRIASHALITDITVGDAKYLSTTRGLSFERIPFVTLFSRFASETSYFAGLALLVLTYASTVMWDISLLYFWIYFIALLLSPFIFNPSQFHWVEFIMDYKRSFSWFINWQRKVSWVKSTREQNTMLTLNSEEDTKWHQVIFTNIWCYIIPQFFLTIGVVIPFIIMNINNVDSMRVDASLRLLVVTVFPIFVNIVVLLFVFLVSSIYGLIVIQGKGQWLPKLLSRITVISGILSLCVGYMSLSFFQRWDLKTILLGVLSSLMLQKLAYQIINGMILPRNWASDKTNESWWNGKWLKKNYSIFSPFMEFCRKVLELSIFNVDFVLAHIIFLFQLPILLIPNIDMLHSLMLFWRKADIDARPIVFRDKRKQQHQIHLYSLTFIAILGAVVTFSCLPVILNQIFVVDSENVLDVVAPLIQPPKSIALESEIGLSAYRNMMQAMFHKTKKVGLETSH